MKSIYITLLIVFFLRLDIFSNVISKEDSLLLKIKTCKVDSQKFDLYSKLIAINTRKSNYDVVKIYGDSIFNLLKKLPEEKYYCMALYYRGNYFYRIGKFDSAIYYDNKSLIIATRINHYLTLIKGNVNLGNIYNQKSDYKKAVICFQKAEKYSIVSADTFGQISTTLNLGSVFYIINDYKQAKKKFLDAIKLSKTSNVYMHELSNAYNNLATVFLNDTPKQSDSAMFYYQLFLKESIKLENKNSIALAYYNIAEVYRTKQEPATAYENYIKAKDLFISMEDSVSLIKVLLGMSDNYILQKNNAEAFKLLKEGLAYSKRFDMQSYTADFLKSLAVACYNMGNYREAYDYYRSGTTISDSLFNAENSEILYDLQTKYESNEKEKQNILLTSQNEISKKTIKQQQATTYFIILGLALTLISVFFIFRSLKQQRLVNKVINEQKFLVEQQKQIVEEHQKEMLDSINYAKKIQYTLLAQNDVLIKNLNDYFILFKPKDIVSGDFYWATEHSGKFYLAICDSTGHGVPGAFMSLLNMGFLSEAIKEKHILQPNEILNYVRKRLIESIGNDGQQDGMDAILICIDNQAEAKKITYAAANNAPIFISRNNLVSKLVELPKDKMPVGKGEKMESFTLQSTILQKGDVLYLYTDGYADQFGGPKGKKFKYKTLNDLLLKNSAKDIHEQSELLVKEFNNWKGDLDQVDDVLIVGIKI